MTISECSNCSMRVIAQSDGTCPSCGKVMADTPTQSVVQVVSIQNALPDEESPEAEAFDAQSIARLRYEVLGNFEAAWQGGVPALADVMVGLPSDLTREARRVLLIDLVISDLEHRWGLVDFRRHKFGEKPMKRTLENYALEFPELRSNGELPAKLKIAEFRVRRAAGKSVQLEEYLESTSKLPDRGASSLVDELVKASHPRPVACSNFALALGVCLLALIVQAVAFGYFGRRLRPFSMMTGGTIVLLISSLVFWLVAHLVLTAKHQDDRHRVVGLRWPGSWHMLLAALLVLPNLICITFVTNSIMSYQSVKLVAAINFERLDAAYQQIAMEPWVTVILVGCVVPAISEELFFRGMIGRGLIKAYGVVTGVLITSIFFGLFHVDPIRILATFILGVALHWVYLTTKSLIAPIMMHALNNLFSFTISRLSQQGVLDPTQNYGFEYISPALFACSCFVVVLLCLVLYRSRVQWVILGAIEWSAGFVSAESPPASIPARAQLRSPGGLWVALCGAGLLACGAAMWDNSISWQALTCGSMALRKMDDGNVESAMQFSEKGLKLRPQIGWLHACRAWVLAQNREWEPALQASERAIDLDSSSGLAYVVRAKVKLEEGRLNDALADCDKAVRLLGDIPAAYSTRANIWLKKHQPEKALQDANTAAKLSPGEDFILEARAQAYDELGKYDLALTDLHQAIKINPRNIFAHFTRALVYEHRGDVDQALADIATCFELEGEQDYLLLNRSRLLLKKNDAGAAMADLRLLVARYPEDKDIRRMRAEAYRKLGDEENAKIEEAAATEPSLQ